MPSAAVIGAAGYAGQETLDRILAHPELELVAIGSDSHAGRAAAAIDTRLPAGLPRPVSNAEALGAGADVVFLCLGHAEAAALEPPAAGVVVDLSGGHRLRDAAAYERWYGFTHPHAASLDGWSYALPELRPPTTRLVANPGCYATAALLALAPLVDLVDPGAIVVDAKSGVTGAGRTPSARAHAGSVLENVTPYRIGTHQHVPEIEAVLGAEICFVPHLVPLRRGLLATCYVRPRRGGLRERLAETYAATPAVRFLSEGEEPDLLRVADTDAAEVALFEDAGAGLAVVTCAIDNLGKGAAGQAVQNANLALGLPETAGLRLAGVLV